MMLNCLLLIMYYFQGTIILAASILVWFLDNYPSKVEYDALTVQAEETYTRQVGKDVLVPLNMKMLNKMNNLQL